MTDRKTINQLTSTDLDELYDRIAHVRHLHQPVGVVAAAEAGIAPDCAACQRAWPCQTFNAVADLHANGDESAGTTPNNPPTSSDTADNSERCCVCGGGSVVYHNHREQPFCWPCADCGCNQIPCVRTGINDPAVSQAAAAPCAGFPDRCPNPVAVPAQSPYHGGGTRCGCADAKGTTPCPACQRADQAGLAPTELHDACRPTADEPKEA